jgi:ribose/xylose/arabinose/galactoside ABC-type transport system permease subunit
LLSAVAGLVLAATLGSGRGGLLGAAAGGAIIFLIHNLLTVANVSVFELNIANGIMLILALALNSFVLARRHRRGLAGFQSAARRQTPGADDVSGTTTAISADP